MRRIKKQIEQSKWLAGQLLDAQDEDQIRESEQWQKDTRHKQLMKDILNPDAFKAWNRKLDQLDTADQWQIFLDHMNANATKGRVLRMRILKTVASVAAVLVIGLSLYYGYNVTKTSEQYQTAAVSIKPGSSQAELVLADGRVVNLEQASEKMIVEGEMAIENTQGVVEYSESVGKTTVQPVTNLLRVPRGGEYQLVLSDGTKVWLNSDTELSYPVPFSEHERRVKLKGEAYFDVAHNASQPFIVESGGQSVEVLGTEFNISAYSEDLNIITTLVEGKVLVEQQLNKQTVMQEYMEPSQQTVLNKETKSIIKQDVDTYLFTSWKDGRFKFDNESLESFFAKVARWYDVEIFITDESVKDIRFTGDLPRYNDMTNILNIIEAEMSVHIEIEDNKIIYVSR